MGDLAQPLTLVRPRPDILRALGRRQLPDPIQIQGDHFSLIRVFKHDSWAATGLYRHDERKIVCKFNRQEHIGPFSMKWLGRRLAAREAYFLQQLSDLPNIPQYSGPVSWQGKPLDCAVAHEFIAGRALEKNERVGDDFFPMLERTLVDIHRRNIAYVDLHKRENILVGENGQPYLIDFQICWTVPFRRACQHMIGAGTLLRWLQLADRYHLMKHWSKCRPDTLPRKTDIGALRPAWIKVHRFIAQPFRSIRRRLLSLIGVRDRRGRVDSEFFTEEALRSGRRAA